MKKLVVYLIICVFVWYIFFSWGYFTRPTNTINRTDQYSQNVTPDVVIDRLRHECIGFISLSITFKPQMKHNTKEIAVEYTYTCSNLK